MTNKTASNRQDKHSWLRGISVSGYKSIKNEQSIEIRPLTILAGANSGGKSSIMQPVLLLKQTLDAPYDPGSLLLDGPNVRLTSADQLLSKKTRGVKEFFIRFDMGAKKVEVKFCQVPNKGLEVFSTTVSEGKTDLIISKDADLNDLKKALQGSDLSRWPKEFYKRGELEVVRDRSFLTLRMKLDKENISFPILSPGERLAGRIAGLIHVPGLRGNPERNYKTTAVGDTFPGTFENYVASVISHWQSNRDDRLTQLGTYLENLGLTWKVSADQRDETQVELKVGRLQHGSQGGARDLVSIADVGFGVSQTLPVLVALLAAQAGQIVYIEQPEIHLHPRAQRTLANIFADAAKRGVIVIVETHSALLIRGIQTLVAKDDLSQDLVKLHWFKRDALGATSVTSADLDEAGAFGDWPEDFDEIELSSDNEYLSAAEAKLFKRQ
ncbi:MAG: AAA family ATPase [Candidatus Nitrotoga sp.]